MTAMDRIGRPLRVCYPFIGNNVGGSHISALTLIRNLDRRKVEPIIVLHEEGPLADYIQALGLRYELIAVRDFFKPPYLSTQNVITLLVHFSRLVAFLRKKHVDVVHTNDMRGHFAWTLASRFAGAKLVWHHRANTFGRGKVKLALAMLSHQIICISRYSAAVLPTRLATRVLIVDNAFTISLPKPEAREEKQQLIKQLTLPRNTQLIGFFGNLIRRKRPRVFLQAAAEINADTDGSFAFLLFGDERDHTMAELTALADDLGIRTLVHMMGFKTPIEPWIAACELLIAPAIDEAFGRTLVEAMILGTPVVAADSGGHREIIDDGQTGLLTEADDPRAFAAAAKRILCNTAFAGEIAQRAHAEATRRYAIGRIVKEITAVYFDTLGIRQKEPTAYPLTDKSLS